MLSRERAPRFVVLLAAALLASLPLAAIPGASPARAAELLRVEDVFLTGTDFSIQYPAAAGAADFTDDAQTANPTPGDLDVTGAESAIQGAALLRAELAASPLGDTSLVSLHLESLPVEIPLSTIPLDRPTAPGTWAELLAGTALEGLPLQTVTWKRVAALNPTGLGAITIDEIDFSGSLLRDLPLAALTFGGTDVTTIEIPLQPGEPSTDDTPAKRWCYLLNQAAAGSCPSPSLLIGQSLIEIGIRGAPIDSIPLKNIPLKNIDLETSPLKNIPLKNIVLDVAPLKNIPLKNIDLQASPLKNIPLKNIDLQASPLKNIPLKNIDWVTSPLKNIPLKNIDWVTSPLKNIPLKNIDLAGSPLKNIPLKNIDLANAPLKNIPLANIDLAALGIDGFVQAGDTVLGNLAAELSATGAPTVLLGAFLDALQPAGTSPEPAPTLGDLRLDLASGVDSVFLAAVFAFMLNPDLFLAVLGDIGTYSDGTTDLTLGDVGVYIAADGTEITLGDLVIFTDPLTLTLGDIAAYLDDSVSLADVLLGLIPASEFPFEDLPTERLGLQTASLRDINGNLNEETRLHLAIVNDSAADGVLHVTAAVPPGAAEIRFTTNPASVQITDIAQSTDQLGRQQFDLTLAVPAAVVFSSLDGFWLNSIVLGPGDVFVDAELPGGASAWPDGYPNNMITDIGDAAEPNAPTEVPDFEGIQLPVNNDTNARRYIDLLAPVYLASNGDVDWYVLSDVRAGARITASVTQLPIDADMVLYGPSDAGTSPTLFPADSAPLPGQLVEDPGLGVGQAAASVAAEALGDLFLANDRPILSISAHRGVDEETVGAIAPVEGTYIVQVSAYNGGASNDPMNFRVKVISEADDVVCPARVFPHPASPAGAPPVIPAGANAVFLTNPGRLEATHGATGAAEVATALADLVAYLNGPGSSLGIVPAVIPLDAYPAVAGAYADWDAAPCSVSAANDVATSITGVLRDIRATNPQLAYVTIVGGDDLVPMGRVPDLTRISNEREYAATFGDELNATTAAHLGSTTLTDDVYGDPSPIGLGNGNSLFVPQLAVGRLVESPSEIAGLLDAFVTNGGGLAADTGLVAGYDFLSDGAHAVASRLRADPNRSVDDGLVDAPGSTTPWTRADLLGDLFPTGTATPAIASINAHYDHAALLPSAGDAGGPTELVTADDFTTLGVGRLAGRILFTMGCHAGLNVPDALLTGGAANPLAVDWAQALAAEDVSVYVANTGYGIGDTGAIAYSERLMALYAKLLDGSLTVGQALAYAKQAYYGSLGAVGVYDLKILQQTAFYGLPFWHLGTAAPSGTPPVPPLPGSISTDPVTGLDSLDVTTTPTFEEVTVPGRGVYWAVEDGAGNVEDPQVTHYRPIQPRTQLSVVSPTRVAHGALVTSLVSTDTQNVDPVIDTPTADLSASAPELPAASVAWPSRIATVSSYVAPYGLAQDLVLVPGQFSGPGDGGTGTQRLFSSVGVRVLYAPGATDFVEPDIATVLGVTSGASVNFQVETTGEVANDADVRRVLIGYHDFDGSWEFVDLARSTPSSLWTGGGPLSRAATDTDNIEYFVQVVDTSGNVAWASDKSTGFGTLQPDELDDRVGPSISAAVTPAANAAGWRNVATTVTFTCDDSGSGLAVDACPDPVDVTDDGAQVVTGSVTDLAGNESVASVTVKVDLTPPVVTVVGMPSNPACTTTDATSGVATAATLTATTVLVNGVPVTTATCAGAVDVAGNAADTVTASSVPPITFIGFYAPIDNRPSVNEGKAGKTYPIQFQLRDQSGALISALSAVTSTKFKTVACGTFTGAIDPLETTTTGTSGLRYDSASQTFIYNWKTPTAKGCYRFELTLADTFVHRADFNLK